MLFTDVRVLELSGVQECEIAERCSKWCAPVRMRSRFGTQICTGAHQIESNVVRSSVDARRWFPEEFSGLGDDSCTLHEIF